MAKIIIKNNVQYDEELTIFPGTYEFVGETDYSYPRIKVEGEWLDLADIDAIKDDIEIIES